MDRNFLVASAHLLPQATLDACEEYTQNLDRLVSLMNARMLGRMDIEELVGAKNLSMMKDNHANHARFIASVLTHPNAEVLVDTVLWVFRAYRSRGFHTGYWAAQLNAWIEVLKTELTAKAFGEIYPYYQWMQVNIPAFVHLSDEQLDAPHSVH